MRTISKKELEEKAETLRKAKDGDDLEAIRNAIGELSVVISRIPAAEPKAQKTEKAGKAGGDEMADAEVEDAEFEDKEDDKDRGKS